VKMKSKSCFFIGHHNAGADIYPMLAEEVVRHIAERGVTEFYVGRYGDFDRMAARAVLEAKERHPEVRLYLVLPYHPAERPMEVPPGFDGTYYPWAEERIPKRLAIVRTNRRMVDICGHLIAYVRHTFGNSGQIVEYAGKRQDQGRCQVVNLAHSVLPLPGASMHCRM